MEYSDSWKEKNHLMASIFGDRAIKLKNWLQQLKWKKVLEIFSLSCTILVVWTVFALPTIFYFIGITKEVSVSENSKQNATLRSKALAQECVKYEGEVCSEELAQWQLCFIGGPQNTSKISIPALGDQQETEASASQVLSFFISVLDPSPECVTAFRSFLCLYLFESCDANNRLYQVTRADCVRLTRDVCKREFDNLARGFLIREEVLPSCDSFQDGKIQCLSDVSSALSDQQTFAVKSSNSTMSCADGFYLSNSSVCRPLCSSWVEPAYYYDNPFFKWMGIALATVAVCLLVFVFIIALVFQRSEMFSFPKYFIIYFGVSQTLTVMISLIGQSDLKKFFCSSNDYIESMMTETPFCTITGLTYSYGLSQAASWILILTLVMFWGIYFPFHYRRFKASGRLKHFHITAVVLIVALPATPALTVLRDGHFTSRLCLPRNRNIGFFGSVLPVSILSGIAATLMVFIFWSILKQFISKALSKGLKKAHEIGKAEAKILFMTSTYILVSSIILITSGYNMGTSYQLSHILGKYFLCQSTGIQPGRVSQCDEALSAGYRDLKIPIFTILNAVAFFLYFVLMPPMLLILVIKCTCHCKQFRKS